MPNGPSKSVSDQGGIPSGSSQPFRRVGAFRRKQVKQTNTSNQVNRGEQSLSAASSQKNLSSYQTQPLPKSHSSPPTLLSQPPEFNKNEDFNKRSEYSSKQEWKEFSYLKEKERVYHLVRCYEENKEEFSQWRDLETKIGIPLSQKNKALSDSCFESLLSEITEDSFSNGQKHSNLLALYASRKYNKNQLKPDQMERFVEKYSRLMINKISYDGLISIKERHTQDEKKSFGRIKSLIELIIEKNNFIKVNKDIENNSDEAALVLALGVQQLPFRFFDYSSDHIDPKNMRKKINEKIHSDIISELNKKHSQISKTTLTRNKKETEKHIATLISSRAKEVIYNMQLEKKFNKHESLNLTFDEIRNSAIENAISIVSSQYDEITLYLRETFNQEDRAKLFRMAEDIITDEVNKAECAAREEKQKSNSNEKIQVSLLDNSIQSTIDFLKITDDWKKLEKLTGSNKKSKKEQRSPEPIDNHHFEKLMLYLEAV